MLILINEIFEKFKEIKSLRSSHFYLLLMESKKKRFGTCLLSKLSIPRLHDEDVSTIATHRPTKTVLQKEPYLQNKKPPPPPNPHHTTPHRPTQPKPTKKNRPTKKKPSTKIKLENVKIKKNKKRIKIKQYSVPLHP